MAPNLLARGADPAALDMVVVDVLDDNLVAPNLEGALVVPEVAVAPPALPARREEDVTVLGPEAGLATPIPGTPVVVGF